MTVEINPDLANAVADRIKETGDEMLCTAPAKPDGFGWSQSFAEDAQWVVDGSMRYFSGSILAISDNMLDSARDFLIVEQVDTGTFQGWMPH